MKTIPNIGDAEMDILHQVWELGEASVAQVHERILAKRKVAYTTVMTLMRNLARKDVLRFRKEGLTYIYSAAVDPSAVRSGLVDHLVDKVFRGSPAALVQTLVEPTRLTEDERRQLEALMAKLEDR